METGRKRRIIFGSASSSLLFLSIFLFRLLEISANRAILFSLRLPNLFLKFSESLTFQGTVISIFSDFLKFLLPFLPIAVGFGVLALYGMRCGEDRKLALISVAPPSVAGLVVFNFSFPSIFLYAGVISSSLLITGLGETYSKELDRWGNFRVGTSSLGKVFLILSVLLTVGVFLHTGSNIDHYREEYRNVTQEVVAGLTSPESMNVSALSNQEVINNLPSKYREYLNSLPEKKRQKILSELRSKTSSQLKDVSLNAQKIMRYRFLQSEKFSSLVDFALFLTAIAIGGFLLFLSKILFGPVAGLVTLSNRFA